MLKYPLYKLCNMDAGPRYCRLAVNPTCNKPKANFVVFKKQEIRYDGGTYHINYSGDWLYVGDNLPDAQINRASELVRIDKEKRERRAAPPSARKVILAEIDNYIAALRLARRPDKTIKDKFRILKSFAALAENKIHVDQLGRNDMLKFKNAMFDEGYAHKTVDTMMAAVSTWMRVVDPAFLSCKKTWGMLASDWPQYNKYPPPEPYEPWEIVAMESCTKDKYIFNLLIRLFRSTGCRLQEITHLRRENVDRRTMTISIEQKPCVDCANCRSRDNTWHPKTPESTREIPISDTLIEELLALPQKGLLFPTDDGKVEGHLLRQLQEAVEESAVKKVKLHRFRDVFCTNKLRDGEDICTVAKWAGHTDINETKGYADWLSSQSSQTRESANRETDRYASLKVIPRMVRSA
jgi:integrase